MKGRTWYAAILALMALMALCILGCAGTAPPPAAADMAKAQVTVLYDAFGRDPAMKKVGSPGTELEFAL